MKRSRRLAVGVVGLVVVLAACGTDASSNANETAAFAARVEWVLAVVAGNNDLGDAFEDVASASEEGDLYESSAATSPACEHLKSVVDRVQRETTPVPIASVAEPWTSFLDEFAAGADLCAAAGRKADRDLMKAAAAAFDRGREHFKDADKAIQTYNEENKRLRG